MLLRHYSRFFFSLYPDPDTDYPLDEDESLEDALHDHTGQPIDWARADLYRVSEESSIPKAYLRAIECARMHADAHGITWIRHPKHLNAVVKNGTIPWKLPEGQR